MHQLSLTVTYNQSFGRVVEDFNMKPKREKLDRATSKIIKQIPIRTLEFQIANIGHSHFQISLKLGDFQWQLVKSSSI